MTSALALTLTLLSYLLICAALPSAQLKAPSIPNTVYLIRHGEKPADGSNGLSPQGKLRAECLVNVFNATSGYDIGYILAERPKSSGARMRPLETVEPLAESLGLTVDTSCSKEDSSCVASAIAAFSAASSANILICWEHGHLTDIVRALGVPKRAAPKYPGRTYDTIWTLQDQAVVAQTSEGCPGLDNWSADRLLRLNN
ncbi:hypothetical protein M0805_003722 [Coniferiporia weirii]|nr:hypothetical protein M0805_003722 [Coniferiporia weirii]